jgi:hypothetical protein
MWRYPVIFVRPWIDNVNIFLRGVGTRMVRKTAGSVLRNLDVEFGVYKATRSTGSCGCCGATRLRTKRSPAPLEPLLAEPKP